MKKDILNKNELKAEIVRKGFSYTTLAQKMGISISAFSKKVNGNVEFKHSEIANLVEELELNKERFNVIFFNNKVA